MLWTLAKQLPFNRCLEIVSEAGYQGVELVGEFKTWSTEERTRILARMRALKLVVDAMSGVKAGFAVPAQTEEFRAQFLEHLHFAKQLDCRKVILLSGNRVEGLAREAQRQTSVENLTWASERAAHEQISIVIEPIDLLENPRIFLAGVTDAFAIARTVNSPNLKVLYDLYHEQRSFGNLIEKFENNADLVGLVHVADVPGRHEPGTGEIDYSMIYRKLAALGYSHWIAMEYYPTGDPMASLKNARLGAEREMTHR
jgi:hydroxypyruvate isomerase